MKQKRTQCRLLTAVLIVAMFTIPAGAKNVSETVSQNTISQNALSTQEKMQQKEEIQDIDEAVILYQGISGDLEWFIDTEGHLTIRGEGNYVLNSSTGVFGMPEWSFCADVIKTATVNVKGITSTASMFYGCSNLQSVDLTGLDTGLVTDMGGMFYGCSSLQRVDVSLFETEIVTDMSGMFYECSSLQNLDVGGFHTGCVTDMSSMFFGCSSLQILDVSNFDTWNVRNMTAMFSGCSSVKALDLSRFNTSWVQNMNGMFSGCSSLQSIDVSHFDMGRVTNVDMMFHNCDAMTAIDLRAWNAVSIEKAEYMVGECDSLLDIYMPKDFYAEIKLPDKYRGNNYHKFWFDDAGKECTSVQTKKAEPVHYSRRLQWLSAEGVEFDLVFQYYFQTGTAVKPKHNIRYKGIRNLKEGIDYTLSYKNNKKKGTATITATGIGNYTGTVSRTYQLIDMLNSDRMADVEGVLTAGKKGNTLELNLPGIYGATRYQVELSNAKGRKGKPYSYTVSGKHNLYRETITKLKSDVYGIRIRIGTRKKYGKWSERILVICQPRASAKGKKGSLMISWKKLKDVDGYEIYMSKKKNGYFTKVATVGKNVTRESISQIGSADLKKGTYYYYVLGKKKAGKTTFRSAAKKIYKAKVR